MFTHLTEQRTRSHSVKIFKWINVEAVKVKKADPLGSGDLQIDCVNIKWEKDQKLWVWNCFLQLEFLIDEFLMNIIIQNGKQIGNALDYGSWWSVPQIRNIFGSMKLFNWIITCLECRDLIMIAKRKENQEGRIKTVSSLEPNIGGWGMMGTYYDTCSPMSCRSLNMYIFSTISVSLLLPLAGIAILEVTLHIAVTYFIILTLTCKE